MENDLNGENVFNKGEQLDLRYGGFWMRFWAYLFDLIIIASINGILIKPLFRAIGLPISASGIFTPINIAMAFIFYAYFVLMTKICGQTVGKMIFGLKVIPLKSEQLSWGTVIFREWIGRYISATLLFLYVVAAFTPKKQAIHDLIADTTVIHEQSQKVKPAY